MRKTITKNFKLKEILIIKVESVKMSDKEHCESEFYNPEKLRSRELKMKDTKPFIVSLTKYNLELYELKYVYI